MDKFTLNQSGCIFDGTYGQSFNDERLIKLAEAYGFTALFGSPEELTIASEEALTFINENACDESVYFEWENGNLMLRPVEQDLGE